MPVCNADAAAASRDPVFRFPARDRFRELETVSWEDAVRDHVCGGLAGDLWVFGKGKGGVCGFAGEA